MKRGEIIRLIIFILLGALSMFYLQPLAYTARYIPVGDYIGGSVEAWVANNYYIIAAIVFGVSLFATLFWYFNTANATVRTSSDVARWQIVWWLLGLLPMIAIAASVIILNESDDALLSLTGFLVFDGLILLYWLPTATSSPKSFKYTPPGALLLRRLIGS